MFGHKMKVFTLLGFAVSVEASWLVIAALVTWSLAEGLLPQFYPQLSWRACWVVGAGGAVGLFASIVFHELCHSLVARRFGLMMRGITLFIFGGVAEMTDEPPSAAAEFWTGIAGPAASAVLAVGFLAVAWLAMLAGWATVFESLCYTMFWMNASLAVFNLAPAFPLDGGRVLRSALWGAYGELRWATNVASRLGAVFAGALMAAGVILFVVPVHRVAGDVASSNYVGGLWLFVTGLFLWNAARSSYRQLLLRQALAGQPVRQFMNAGVVSVSPATTVGELVENYIYKYHFTMFPVVGEGRLTGCISTAQVKLVPRADWGRVTAGDLAAACADNAVAGDSDAAKALARMLGKDAGGLLVLDGDRLAGIVTVPDILRHLALQREIEERGEK